MRNKMTKRLTRHRRTPWVGAVAGLMVSTLALAGCAGGSGGGAGDDGQLVMRATGPTFTDLPTLVILAEDYFTEVGLDVDFEFIAASNAANAVQALVAGEMDFTSGGTGALYSAYGAGMKRIVSLGTINPAMTFGFAVNNETAEQLAAQGVTPDSPVEERVAALKGLQLAVSPEGSTGQKYLRIMLETYGVDADNDVTLVPNADNAAQLAAARQGRVNGFANSFPNTNLPEADGWGVLWLNFAEDLRDILPLAAQDIYTTPEWVDANPEDAAKVMEAYKLALADLQDPSEELKDKIKNLPEFKDLNPAGFDLGWELSVPVYQGADPATTQEQFDNQLDLVNYGSDSPIDIEFDDLYDLSAVEEAGS